MQNLIDAVKIALLKEVGESDNAKLTADIKSYDDNRYIDLSASGRSLAEIANRFAAANAEKLASKAAKAETKLHFRRLVNNFASAAYLDKKNDRERLAYLIARQMEVYVGHMKASLLKDLDAKASRCAQMLRVAYPDYKVNVAKAKDAIATTIERLVKAAYPDKINPEDQQKVNTARRYLKHIHFNGTLFTERLEYDIGHRAAGKNEINLHDQLKALRSLVKKFANVASNEYMTKIGA